jgi:hypothetical protein
MTSILFVCSEFKDVFTSPKRKKKKREKGKGKREKGKGKRKKDVLHNAVHKDQIGVR